MSKTFNMYCDESTHLQNDGEPFMLISYVSCAYPQIKQHKEYFKLLKEKHKFKGEIKWSNVSKSQYPFYADVIDYFFATDLKFRCVIIDKSKIDESRDGFTYSDFYFKMYYQLIYQKIQQAYNYNIYLDIKDTNSQNKLHKLGEILNHHRSIRNIQFIKSYESYLLQLTDLMMGAINYHIRDLDRVIAKNRLIEKIQSHSNIDLNNSTPWNEEKFNLFYIELS